MRILAFILLFLFNNGICAGQVITDKQKIADFKRDILNEVFMPRFDTLRLNDLMLVKEQHGVVRRITTFQKNKNIVLYEHYYSDTRKLMFTYALDTLGQQTGIENHYSEKGVWEYSINWDNGTWIAYDKKNYPFYSLQNKMKVKADSLISKMYGHSFLTKNAVWNVTGSYMSNAKEVERWTDLIKKTPTSFMFRYDVKLDKGKRYDRLIEFEIDKDGNFIPNEDEFVFGFEDVPDSLRRSFKLSYEDAIAKAKSLGLTENDSAKAVGLLYWENFRKPIIYNGRFRFYVLLRTGTIDKDVPHGHSSRTIKYDVYSFNPWTGDFIEKKKMMATNALKIGSGLIADND
ncbi:MAG: hypothetical protein J7621_02110 [Niastella sp.]|nr:hypothetical protein [Niastella sp.]